MTSRSPREFRQNWPDRIRSQLAQVVEEGRWRAPREFDALGPVGALEGVDVVSFASNDYLGLSAHPDVVAAAHAALERWGTGAGASRLVTGSRPIHAELERELAEWKRTEAAVCFPSGFAANLGVLSVLGGPGVRVFSDELNHASIIDGCRLSRSEVSVYRHRDFDHLEANAGVRAGDGRDAPAVGGDGLGVLHGRRRVAPSATSLSHLRSDMARCSSIDEAHAVLPGRTNDEASSAGRSRAFQPSSRAGTLSKQTLGALGGFVAACATSSTYWSTGRGRTSSRPRCHPPTPAAGLAAVRTLRSSAGEARSSTRLDFVGAAPDRRKEQPRRLIRAPDRSR